MPLVLIINALGLARGHRQRHDHLAQELHGQFIEADNRALSVKGQVVEVQDVFHPRHILTRYRPDAPRLFPVRLEPVFFSTSLTVLCEMLSQKPSSIALSASRRNVHRACPVGAVEHARAVILARATPSMRQGCPERGLLCRAAARPSARYRRLILNTVATPT